jgi:hypothetical protein
VYEPPALSKIPGGYNARQVDLTYINNDRAFREALLKPTTTFFLPEFYVFACTLEDKRKLVAWMKMEGNKYTNLIVFWPGKYQSHAFSVRRRCGAMTRIMELLGPTEKEKNGAIRMDALRQIRKMRAELNAMEHKVQELDDDAADRADILNDEVFCK